MSRRSLTRSELSFLSHPPQRALARIATVDSAGLPHVVAGGWSYDSESGDLILGGREVPQTRRAQFVRDTGVAAVVIDGLADGPGWRPWGIQVRGRASVDEAAGAIRLTVDDVTSWGLEAVGQPA